MQDIAAPRIKNIKVRAVCAPLDKPHKTASGTLKVAPLVLLDVETNAGISGCSYVFVYTPLALKPVAELLRNLEELLIGAELDPAAVTAMLQARFRLLGNQGLTGIAVAAVDMALWDAMAKFNSVSLSRLLDNGPIALPVYDSLGQMGPDETAKEIESSLNNGFNAFKVKAGHPDANTDLAVAKAIKKVAGDDVWFAMDFNQAFTVEESIRRLQLLDEEGLAWIEEPVRAEDYNGHASVREAIRTPVQTGENWWGLPDMTKAIVADASDYVMPDVMKIGGVSGWMDAAWLAAANDLPVSSHLFVEVSSHLLAVTLTAHRLEWFDVARSINETPLSVNNGAVIAHDLPGIGLSWNEKAIAEYLI